jgi:hypothetical protein
MLRVGLKSPVTLRQAGETVAAVGMPRTRLPYPCRKLPPPEDGLWPCESMTSIRAFTALQSSL